MSSLPAPLSPAALPLQSPLSTSPVAPNIVAITEDAAFDASRDAREIVRRAQCPQCSLPLHTPVTLPCGNTLCKLCIPTLFPRENITYPGTEERRLGFKCPFEDCTLDHAVDDISVNVVLNKIMVNVKEMIHKCMELPEAEQAVLSLEEKNSWATSGVTTMQEKASWGQVMRGGRIVSTYIMAERGQLPYNSDVVYTDLSGVEKTKHLDTVVLEHLKEVVRLEVDCQICYTLFHDPFTMTCGHTFCRKCLHQVLDHSNLCPVCRRKQGVPPGLSAPVNLLLSKLIVRLFPQELSAKVEAEVVDQKPNDGLTMPVFVCTLSFPTVPTFLHIFELRYRLMIKRAIESGDKKFGMVLHNPSREAQGELGRVPFYQYGTLLHIVAMHIMPDGRSLIETVGVSRFKILKYGQRDGYTVAQIERIDDMTLSAEETIEARETTSPTNLSRSLSSEPNAVISRSRAAASQTASFQDLHSHLSTRALYEFNVNFVKKMRDKSAPWLHRNVFHAYGEIPTDVALFPWWFASILPLEEKEKYHLLATTSVRERLKITTQWVLRLEGTTWSESSGCIVI